MKKIAAPMVAIFALTLMFAAPAEARKLSKETRVKIGVQVLTTAAGLGAKVLMGTPVGAAVAVGGKILFTPRVAQ